MEILDLSHNDDLTAIVRKCNLNFRNLAWSARQAIGKQSRIDTEAVMQAMALIRDDILNIVNVLIPGAVDQAMPPIGSYVLSDFDPTDSYPNTLWQQVDTVTTDGMTQIPVWQRYIT